MNLEQLRARHAEILESLRALHTEIGEDAEPTEDQQTRWDALDGEEADVRGQIEQAVQDESRAARVAESRRRFGAQFQQRVDTGVGEDVMRMSTRSAVDRARKLLEDRDATEHLPEAHRDQQLAQLDKLLRTQTKRSHGHMVARRLLLTETEHYRSAWQKLVTRAQAILTPEEARAYQAFQEFEEFRAMAGSVDASGGYGVPVLIDPTIILTAQGSLNPMRRLARVEQITTDEWKGVSSAGVSWSYDAEGSAVSDDSPTLAQPNVVMATARGFIPFSVEIGMDYPSFAEQMVGLLGEGYDELQAQSFITGSGSGQPFGILTALDANTNVEVTPTTDGAFGGVDINKVWGALPDRWKQNATWLMNHDVGNEVATFGNGNNLSFVTVDLTGELQTLRKRPVEFASYMPDFTGTTGASNILIVGDFRNYLIADRIGMSIELVPHLFDVTNNRPTLQRGWIAWARHGADSVNDLGFRLLQNQ